MNGNFKQEYFFVLVGLCFFILAGLVNEWTVASWLSYGGFLDVFDRVVIAVFDVLMMVCGIFFIWRRKRLHVGFPEFGLFCGTLVLLFAGSEVVARVIDNAHGHDFLKNKQRAERGIVPFRMFGPDWYAKEGDIRYIVGRHGERYPFTKAEGTFRIVAIGGSTTQQQVEGIDFPRRLEELLQKQYPEKVIEVINVGNSSYPTAHFIILLSLDIISWNPDLIIASENINDLTATYFPNFALDYGNKFSNEAFLAQSSRMQVLFGWSRLYWVLRSRLEAFSYRMLEAADIVYTRKSYGNNPPLESSAVFRRNWETILSIAHAKNIPIIMASQPLEPSEEYWDLHMRYKKYNNVSVYPLHAEFLSHHTMFNDIIKKVAGLPGAYFLDNAAVFSGKKELFSDFVHYTRTGIEQLAKNYAAFIAQEHFIK